MTKFVTVAFRVSADEAEQMTHESVYLDVFGHVRWNSTGEIVQHASSWSVMTERTSSDSRSS